MTKRLLTVALAAVTLSACGSSSPHRTGANGTPTVPPGAGTSGSATPAPGTTASPGQTQPTSEPGRTGGPATSQSATPGSSTQSTPQQMPTTVQVTLSKTCVRPGDAITVNATASRPGMALIFDTSYPDGKDGQVHGGIEKKGKVDSSGHYSSTWTLDRTTPPGDAAVLLSVIDQYGNAGSRTPFRIALAC